MDRNPSSARALHSHVNLATALDLTAGGAARVGVAYGIAASKALRTSSGIGTEPPLMGFTET